MHVVVEATDVSFIINITNMWQHDYLISKPMHKLKVRRRILKLNTVIFLIESDENYILSDAALSYCGLWYWS